MFDIESKNPDEITINTKNASVTFNVLESSIDAGLVVGKIQGPGEFEIGEITIRGIDVDLAKAAAKKADDEKVDPEARTSGKTIYDAKIGDVHVGIIGGCEDGLDDLGVADVLCTSSVRAIREIEPKVVVSMGNIDGMVTDLKLTARTEKKYKVKNADALPATLEVIALN